MERPKVTIKADKLRALLSMPEWAESVGGWLDQALIEGVHKMSVAETDREFFSSQGSYLAILAIKQNIDSIFQEEKALLARQGKKTDQG